MARNSWNWQDEWFPVLSANEWVLATRDESGEEGAAIPMLYALQLLIDHFGAERLHALIDETTG